MGDGILSGQYDLVAYATPGIGNPTSLVCGQHAVGIVEGHPDGVICRTPSFAYVAIGYLPSV